MRDATVIHNKVLRDTLQKFQVFICLISRLCFCSLSLSPTEPMAHLRQGLWEACTIIYLSIYSLSLSLSLDSFSMYDTKCCPPSFFGSGPRAMKWFPSKTKTMEKAHFAWPSKILSTLSSGAWMFKRSCSRYCYSLVSPSFLVTGWQCCSIELNATGWVGGEDRWIGQMNYCSTMVQLRNGETLMTESCLKVCVCVCGVCVFLALFFLNFSPLLPPLPFFLFLLHTGLRVRMGVHVGTPRQVRDPLTRKIEFVGPAVNLAARITALAHGGQVSNNFSLSDFSLHHNLTVVFLVYVCDFFVFRFFFLELVSIRWRKAI